MQVYVGYGFNTNGIKSETWLKLMETHDPELYEELIEESKTSGCNGDEETAKWLNKSVTDKICENANSEADYLADIINAGESETAQTDYIVATYDSYLVFDSVRFADDSPRTKYIRTATAFIQMIGKYVPTDDLTFGNLYDGVEWADPCYFID